MEVQLTKQLKNSKGITMITLVVGILILVLITGMTIYYSKESIKARNLRDMYNDIELLNDRISTYYLEKGEIPVLTKFTNIPVIDKNPNDNENYYVIDLSKLDDVSLKYGKDFEKYKAGNYTEESSTDVYVINEQSMQIYYIKGIITSENKYIYTIENTSEITLKVTRINSIEDLVRFEQAVNGGENFEGEYVFLSSNLDFSSKDSYDGTTVTINGIEYKYGGTNDLQTYLSESGKGFTPIGTEITPFSGTFDGKGYEIKNLYISGDNYTIFNNSNGIVKNINIIK